MQFVRTGQSWQGNPGVSQTESKEEEYRRKTETSIFLLYCRKTTVQRLQNEMTDDKDPYAQMRRRYFYNDPQIAAVW